MHMSRQIQYMPLRLEVKRGNHQDANCAPAVQLFKTTLMNLARSQQALFLDNYILD